MYKLSFVFLFVVLTVFDLKGQCIPDEEFIPVSANYGLSPDTLAIGYVNQNYNQDLTFVLPMDTIVEIEGFGENLIVFEDYHITSISLPIGLSWECNNSDNDCHYDPTITQYGCVNLYGTPLEYGDFNVDVTVIATHELSWVVGPEEISFSLPLTILPNISANSGFAMTNFSGCAPLTVDFINNNPGLESYSWDFGNGNVSMLENPTSQLYNQPGEYLVHYIAHTSSEPFYFLTNVEIQNASGWGNEFPDEENLGILGLGSPDFYFTITDESQNIIYQSNVLEEQNLPVSFSLDNLQLLNQNYTINVYEEDGVISNNDYCGSVDFQGFSNSATLNNGSLVVNYTTYNIQPTPFADVIDTIYVYDSPNQPSFSFDEENITLTLDSDSLDLNYQWYYVQSPIPNANNISYVPENSGYYYLLSTNEYGCSAASEDQTIVVCDDFAPELVVSFDTISFLESSIFEYQWFLDGEQILDQSSHLIIADQEGSYSLVLVDQWGCKYNSNEIFFSTTNIADLIDVELSIFPNPATNYIDVFIGGDLDSFSYLEIYDMQGRKLINVQVLENTLRLNLDKLEKGAYLLKLNSNNEQQIIKRFLLN